MSAGLNGGAVGTGGVIDQLIGHDDVFGAGNIGAITNAIDGTTYSIDTAGGNTIAKDFYTLSVDATTGKVTYTDVASNTALATGTAYAVKDSSGNYKSLTNYYVKATTTGSGSSASTAYALVSPGSTSLTPIGANNGTTTAYYKVDPTTINGLATTAESVLPTAGAIPSFHALVNARTGVKGLEQTVNEVVNQTGVASASDALKLQLEFIKYSTQITAASQMTKTIGEAMNSTVRNIG